MTSDTAPDPRPLDRRPLDPRSLDPRALDPAVGRGGSRAPGRPRLPVLPGGPGDLVALVWYRMGYRPRESVVVLGLHTGGPDGAVAGAVLRCDLPPPELFGEATQALVHALTRQRRPDRIWAMVASAEVGAPGACESGGWRDGVLAAFAAAGVAGEVEVEDVVGVGPEGYASLAALEHAPPGGWPLSDVDGSPTAAEMVLSGSALVPDRAALAREVDARPGASAAGPSRPRPPERWLALWSAALWDREEPVGLDEVDARGLGLAIHRRPLRDALLAVVADVPRDLAQGVLEGAPLESAALLDHALAQSPDPVRAVRAHGLLASAARELPGRSGAEAVAMLAWLAWWSGDGGRSRVLAERALERDREHRVAQLLLVALDRQKVPAWVAR